VIAGGPGEPGATPAPLGHLVLVPALPWPLPAALGAACGVAARANDLPLWALMAMAAPLILLARGLLLRPRSSSVQSVRPAPRALVAVLLPLLAAGLGFARMGQWLAAPDPLSGLRGQVMLLTGRSDGRVLTLDEPPRVRVAASPAGALPAGQVELRGTLLEAAGRRNPGGFDYRAYLRGRGVRGQVLVAELLEVHERTGLRERLRRGVTRGLSPTAGALLEAMTLGVRDDLGELRDDFAAAGLAHVLALSGLHVGLLMAAVGGLLAALGVWRYPVLLAVLLGYVLLVGTSPSVTRAAVMVGVVLLGLWAGAGRIDPWPAMGLAALVTLLLRPAWLFDLAFQLSYLSVAGILLFALPLARRLRGDPPVAWWHPRLSVVGALLTSASAQALTLPLVGDAFGTIPLLSPLVNVVALPVASLLVPLGFAAGLLGLVALPLAGLVNLVTWPLAQALLELARAGARLPLLTWGEVEPAGMVLFALAVAAAALAARGLLRPWRALSVVCAAGLLSAGTPAANRLPELVALDVGQGDSFLLRLPGRIEVLFDGGGTPFSTFDTGEGIVLPALRAMGVDELELVVASHSDADHIEGLASVLRGIPVQLLLIGVAEPDRPIFARLMEAADERGVAVRPVSRGERIVVGDLTLEVLNPAPRDRGGGNDDSVALAAYLGGVPRALLLGDISAAVESELAPPPVDVLVAPHHGSAGSSSTALLMAARPRDAVISVGRNRYGHPAPEVLLRLAAVGARVHITSEGGAVRLPLEP
jgi:competence protein ComEC